jgi:hypothetical protein
MGRIIPSFRIASVEEGKEWKKIRQALDTKSDRKVFDNIMFSIAHLYGSACSYINSSIHKHIQQLYLVYNNIYCK